MRTPRQPSHSREWPELVLHGCSPCCPGYVRPPATNTTRAASVSVATLTGEASHHPGRPGASPCRGNLEHRGATGSEPDSGDGAGILPPGARRVLPRGGRISRPSPEAGGTPSASPSCRSTALGSAVSRIETIAEEEGLLRVLGRARGPRSPRRCWVPPPAPPCRSSARSSWGRAGDLPPAIAPDRATLLRAAQARRAARPASTSRRCPRAPSSTRAC